MNSRDQVWGLTPDEIEREHAFRIFLDRDLRDCIFYAWLLGLDEIEDGTCGWGGAMFELNPAEIVGWHWRQDLAAYAP